jgi:hypothetical protein
VSIRSKILISFFILFHWTCVVAWLLPNPSAIKSFLLSVKSPFSSHGRQIVATYLHWTANWQDWAMFAPNPLQSNRYLGAIIHFNDGATKRFDFPNFSRLGYFEAHIQKRSRKFQQRIMEETTPGFRADLCRTIARRFAQDPGTPPTRVVLNEYRFDIPRHDREELKDPNRPKWINYTKLLRHRASYRTILLLDYTVRPEDL